MSHTIPVRQYYSAAQTAIKNCPDGTVYSLTLAAGSYLSFINQDDANMRALSIARRRIIDRLMCLSPLTDSAVKNYPFYFQFTVLGGRPEYTFSLIGGSLPHGLSLDQFGLLSGTPTQAGMFVFTIQVSDEDRPVNTIQKTYTLLVQ